ncbi:Uncharacterised protein [Bacillus freudenreichii]|nr:Uncharacterised protein [Bacillus freudenreichii]
MVKDSKVHREPRNGNDKRPDEQKEKKGKSNARGTRS